MRTAMRSEGSGASRLLGVGLGIVALAWTGCSPGLFDGGGGSGDDGSSAPSTTSGGTTGGTSTGGSTTGGTTTGGTTTGGSTTGGTTTGGSTTGGTTTGGTTTGGSTTGGLLSGVSFVESGVPTGYPAITDLTVFQGRLYIASSLDPLGSFGSGVVYTTDGSTFTTALYDEASQGFLRIRIIDNQMYIADGDPNGYDPSYVYISADGLNFRQTVVTSALHTFDVIKYQGDLLCSNGLRGGAGLCRTPDNGASPWSPLGTYTPSRFKYMAQFNGRLYVGRDASGGEGDYWMWSADVDTTYGQERDLIPGGSAETFNWYVSSRNRLFWTGAEYGYMSARLLRSDDGDTWTEVQQFRNDVVSDMAELNGNLYVLASTGLWGSTDHTTFTQIAAAPSGAFALDPNTPDAIAAIAAWNGKLWCGSNRNGRLYRIE